MGIFPDAAKGLAYKYTTSKFILFLTCAHAGVRRKRLRDDFGGSYTASAETYSHGKVSVIYICVVICQSCCRFGGCCSKMDDQYDDAFYFRDNRIASWRASLNELVPLVAVCKSGKSSQAVALMVIPDPDDYQLFWCFSALGTFMSNIISWRIPFLDEARVNGARD